MWILFFPRVVHLKMTSVKWGNTWPTFYIISLYRLTKRFNVTELAYFNLMSTGLQVRSKYFKLSCEISKVWGARLNDVSCFCLAGDVQKQLDSTAPRTGPRLMICDSFNEPGYEQSSCSHYISRNSCCFSRGFDFSLYPLLIEVWQYLGPSPSHTNRLNNTVEAAGIVASERLFAISMELDKVIF